jgi:hypothetical protein
MSSFRISLASVLGIVAVLALALAGVTSASSVWTALAATVALALLLTAVLAAWILRGPDRAFCAGFAVFGWAYLVLVNWDWVGGQFGHDLTVIFSEAAEVLLPEVPAPARPTPLPPAQPATALLLVPDGLSRTDRTNQIGVPPPAPLPVSGLNYNELVLLRQAKIGNFVQISRTLFSLLFAMLGGFIGRALAVRGGRQAESGSSVAPG